MQTARQARACEPRSPQGLIRANPMRRVEQVPSGGESDHGEALDEADLATLMVGYKSSATMFPPVAIDAATGARRNELAFRWTDLDVEKKAFRVERALEVTKKFGTRFKPPKPSGESVRSRWMTPAWRFS